MTAHKLEYAYEFFFSAIQETLGDADLLDRGGSETAVLEALFETVRRQFQFVVIKLESEDDPRDHLRVAECQGRCAAAVRPHPQLHLHDCSACE